MKKGIQFLLAGALFPLAFAPVSLPGLAIISVAWFFYLLQTTEKKWQSFKQGWLYGLGVFGVGTSWIYVSIHTYGQAEPWLAVILTILFSLFMGLYVACFTMAFCWLFNRKINKKREKTVKDVQYHQPQKKLWAKAIGFSALWVLFEYVRANLFTGFPWLLLGFSQTETPMQYLAPIIGVYGLSFLVALSGCLLAMGFILLKSQRMHEEVNKELDSAENLNVQSLSDKKNSRKWVWPIIFMLMLYILPYGLKNSVWIKSDAKKVSVSIIQGNINENEKWLPNAYQKTLQRYIELTKKVPKDTEIIVWPEGAVPVPYPQAQFFLKNLPELIDHKATIVTGIPYEHPKKPNHYYNAMVVLENNTQDQYFKHHLVPFGEYLPASIFHDIANYLHLEVYETSRGVVNQPLLKLKNIHTLPFICYEIAYADILFNSLSEAELLITISDDAWFGHSMARAQHLQMAQMRSLQSGRYQIVATNNGISAIIDSKGKIISTVPSFETQILNSYIQPISGKTPWAELGDNWIVLAIGVLLFACILV